MKWTLYSLLMLAVGTAGLGGQIPAKSRPAQTTPPPLMTDQEKNIRAYIDLLRSDLRKERAHIVVAVMQLDAEEAATFWPIYKDFEAEYTQFDDSILALMENFADHYPAMTNQAADHLATRLLDLERTRNSLKRKYYRKFKEALDAITAARFLQVENQLERIIDSQISPELTVTEGPRSQP